MIEGSTGLAAGAGARAGAGAHGGGSRSCPEIGWGEWRLLEAGDDAVLALACAWRGGGCVVTLHNMGAAKADVSLDLDGASPLMLLLGSDDGAAHGEREPGAARNPITLAPHAYRWFRMGGERR